MFLKFLFKSICLGFLVGLIVYAISRLLGLELSSILIGEVTGILYTTFIPVLSLTRLSKLN
jgi:hypothetical protein